MTRPTLALTLSLAAASVLLPCGTQGAVVYRSNEGWTVEGDANSQVEGSAAEQMRKAENLEAEGNTDGALDAYRNLLKRYGKSVLAPKAQLKVGVLLERSARFDKAYEAYDAYLTKYPRAEDFDSVVESMFKIGQLFLEGEKRRVLGVPISPSMARAQEMFTGIVKKAPYSKWAPLSQFNIGQALEKQGKLPESIAAYQQVVARYPNDAIADDALYQIGYVRLREHRDGSYDRASAQKAREAFEDFINRYPDSEKVAQARENLKNLEGTQTQGSLQIAKFYDRTKQYKAAVIYYNDVIRQQPGSPESEVAKARIAALKEQVGEDALRAGPERTETGARATARRRMQARVDTVSRPDYAGPPVKVPEPVETAPTGPKLRTSPSNLAPVPAVEPPLPSEPEALTPETGLPQPTP
jgi:outer membrane protein assembly factor BamD